MIELIFAIVIMGITLMSIPMVVNQASQSTNTTLQQEAIAAAASDMSLILSRAWDESNTDNSERATILTTTSGTFTQSDRNNTQSRTYTTSNGSILSASTIGNAEGGDIDDVDDTDGMDIPLVGMGGEDLIDKVISIHTTVSYLSDTSIATYSPSAGSATSNIKGISILLTTTNPAAELDKNITLNAFSCNIGSYELERKVF
ncbi:MAG TPA: hypothetical protein EYP60_09880 [bacterium (Candidatus Stahlbacteria)]|nr:hypothetical protein [Candidatus Stahlbacteria bacterium]